MPPQAVVVAIQYWGGDEAQAFRLARLLADIEPKFRDDVVFAFCRRFDMVEESAELWKTRMHVGAKFPTIAMRSKREGVDHPAGCNALWAGVMDHFSESWHRGRLGAHSIFTAEADGVPLRVDWLDRLLKAHRRTLEEGKRVTGPLMQVIPHINGSLIAHLSLWFDRPSLHHTPPTQGWDLFHAHAILAEARPDPWIKNVYGACNWSPESLFAMSHETAWLASQKCDTAIEWAERNLVATSPTRKARRNGCHCPDPQRFHLDECPHPRITALEAELAKLKDGE